MAGQRLTLDQEHSVYLASVLAVRAGREMLEQADAQAFEVGAIAETLFQALSLLGRAFPGAAVWIDPDQRGAEPGTAGHA